MSGSALPYGGNLAASRTGRARLQAGRVRAGARTYGGRSTATTRRRRWLVLGLLCLLAPAPFGGHALLRHLEAGYLVKTFCVEGARALPPEEIAAASGLTSSTSLLFLSAAMVEQRVKTLPYVKDCRVMREFPDTVYVTVTERIPKATLLVDNRCYAIDGEYVVLEELPIGEDHPGPLIACIPDLGSVEPGETLAKPELLEALAVWDAFSRTAMATDVTISEIAALRANDIRMYCDQLPFELRWGRGRYDSQARRLDILWERKERHLDCTEYLDLRFGKDLVCK